LQSAFSTLSPETQAEALQILSQAEELIENEPIRFFTPNPAQQAYIDAAGKPEGFIVVFAAANGLGKTAATVALIAAIIWPELAPSQHFKSWVWSNWPYPKDFRIISTPQQLAEGGSIQREIKRWFPRGQYQANKNGKPYVSQYIAKDFTLNLMSYDMAVEAFEGATCGLVVFDEPPPKPIFNACAARMRRGGRLLFPGTPLMDAAWILDDLVAKADGEYIQLVHGDIEQNCADHTPGGILKHSDIERMISSYDPDELDARKNGKFMHLSGRIYKGFDRSVHVAKEPIIPRSEGFTHLQAIDPAIGKPIASIWAQVDASGVVQVYDESPSDIQFEGARDSNLSVSDYIQLFRAKEQGRNISVRILDRHFGNVRRTMGGLTLRQDFAEKGMEFVDSYATDPQVEVETGILKVKEYLKYDKSKPLDSLNTPKIVISPTCKNTIASFERWGRNPDTGKPKEEYKDFADCVRYLLMRNPVHEIASSWTPSGGGHYGVNV
jgi:hypothetical protein